MTPFFSFHSAILIVLLSYPTIGYDDAIKSYFSNKRTLVTQQSPEVHTVAAKDERRTDPSRDSTQASEYRPAREIKRFTEPTIFLRGTAEEIGLDSRTLTTFLERQFLRDFAFLQSDFAFEKTYETWEIGLFECEAWTVGGSYPIAFHVQCTGGSMDEPRHWRFATLGYGPKEKIVDMVRKTLDSIVAEYATFVRKAHGRIES
jgi:hypothetical protein